MTQDERWLARYNEIMAFVVENHRRPSKYKPERVLFDKLLALCGEYRRVNQYV